MVSHQPFQLVIECVNDGALALALGLQAGFLRESLVPAVDS